MECCVAEGCPTCDECPFDEFCCYGTIKMVNNALDLINRQKEEIDRLKFALERANKYGVGADRENERLLAEIKSEKAKIEIAGEVIRRQSDEIDELRKHIKDKFEASLRLLNDYDVSTAKAEAIKEFSEKIKDSRNRIFNCVYSEYHFGNMIETLVKEFTEEKP